MRTRNKRKDISRDKRGLHREEGITERRTKVGIREGSRWSDDERR